MDKKGVNEIRRLFDKNDCRIDRMYGCYVNEQKERVAELKDSFHALQDEERFGLVLRAKGLVDSGEGEWLYFDYVPGEVDLRRGGAAVTGRLCVIGSKIHEDALKELFGL